MRYIDSSRPGRDQTVAHWMQSAFTGPLSAVRWQSGYFDADAIGFMVSVLGPAAAANRSIVALIGANVGGTAVADVEALVRVLGLPRRNVSLALVRYNGALFHPKVMHVTRDDGSSAAYVGSANLTRIAVEGKNVEAGVILDTQAGDPKPVLDEIADTIDDWFRRNPPELLPVRNLNDVKHWLQKGALLAQRAPLPPSNGTSSAGSSWPTRKPAMRVPALPPLGAPSPASPPVTTSASTGAGAASAAWPIVWESRKLIPRDVNLPQAKGGSKKTNRTGSMTLKKGAWRHIDQRTYFRHAVFSGLPWSPIANKPNQETAVGNFEVWKDGALMGTANLTIKHDNATTTRTYKEKNSTSHLRWGTALPWVQDPKLIGGKMQLRAEPTSPGIAPRFRIDLTTATASAPARRARP